MVPQPYIVSAIKAYHLLRKGFQGYLCIMIDFRDTGVKLEDIPIARDFSNVFPKDLPSVLIEREVDIVMISCKEHNQFLEHCTKWP